MNRPIKIGFLSTYSSIYPELNQQLMDGFVLAHEGNLHADTQFEFIPEYVHQGGVKSVGEAIKKLLYFNQVDIISGLLSYQVIPQMIPVIESRQKLAFFFDLGEYLPSADLFSPNVFFNSYQLWQAEYALGHWAHQHFGGKGMVLMPLYESGYQMHTAFRQGTVSAGSEVIDYHLLPYQQGLSSVAMPVDHLLEKLKKNPPDYLHVLFSGMEASEFLEKFYSSELPPHIPLLVSPLMAHEEWLAPLSRVRGECYTASVWSQDSLEPANQRFVEGYRLKMGKNPSVFALLGYEMGLAFSKIACELQNRDWLTVMKFLQEAIISGPRGHINFWHSSDFIIPEISIEKIQLHSSGYSRTMVVRSTGMPYNAPVFNDIHQETKTGWQNPYLSV